MNAGMFGLPNGQPGAARKVAASNVGRSRTAVSGAVGVVGAAAQSVALTAGVRTRVLAVNGRGALRAAAIDQFIGTVNLRLELWVDGVLVADTGTVSTGTGTGLIALGFGAAGQTPIWDWVPFDSSLEVWATSGTSGSPNVGVVYDIHQ